MFGAEAIMKRGATAVAFVFISGAAAAQLPTVDSKLVERHYRDGVQLMRSERWEQAATEFKTAIEIDPLMALAHYNLGQCRMAQKRFVEAVTAYQGARAAFERLATLSQKDRESRDRARRDEINEIKTSLTRLNLAKGPTGAYSVALENRLRTLEAMDSRDRQDKAVVPGEVMLALGSAYFRQEKLADAERQWLAAVGANPKLGEAHNNLAALYMMTGRKTDAEEAVKAAERAGFRVNPGLKDDIKRMGS
jgi:tetratricopeptide (TPR) repeat protein